MPTDVSRAPKGARSGPRRAKSFVSFLSSRLPWEQRWQQGGLCWATHNLLHHETRAALEEVGQASSATRSERQIHRGGTRQRANNLRPESDTARGCSDARRLHPPLHPPWVACSSCCPTERPIAVLLPPGSEAPNLAGPLDAAALPCRNCPAQRLRPFQPKKSVAAARCHLAGSESFRFLLHPLFRCGCQSSSPHLLCLCFVP